MTASRSGIWWLAWLMVVATIPLSEARSAPVDSAVANPAAGDDTVVIGISQEPETLNPIMTVSSVSPSILQTIFIRDVQRDADWKPFAQGVEELPSVQRGTWQLDGEQMTLHWNLRPRTWHDGRPVTCSDYVFSQALQRSGNVPGATFLIAPRIADVSCPNGASGTAITVVWQERYAYANLQIIEIGPLPRHLLELLFRASPSRFAEVYGVDPRATVGDGAYQLVEWRKGESITVESVGGHSIFGTPRIKRIIWRVLPADRLVTAMLAGAIDAIGEAGISIEQAFELERNAAGRVRVIFEPGLTWEHIDFNLDNPFLRDIRVRRAIASAVNRTQLIQRLLQGKAFVSYTYLPPKHPGYTDAVERYPHDPARARALLRAAGFSPGPDGIMRNAAGERITLELNSTAGIQIREDAELIVQQQLRQIGIEITIFNYPRRVLFGELNTRRKFKAMSMYAWTFDPDTGCNLLYTSDGIPSEQNRWEGANFMAYTNSEMDRVCKAAEREIDTRARNLLLNKSARIFARDLPALPLYFRPTVGAVKRRLQNYSVVGLGLTHETWNAHTWYWK